MHNSNPVRRAAPSTPEPIYFTRRGALYRLRIWSEREWALIASKLRHHAEYFSGLGWVGGEFITMMSRTRAVAKRPRSSLIDTACR
jgi:hypothetical protein